MEGDNRQHGVVFHEDAQDAFSYGNNDVKQGHLLSLDSEDDLEFEEDCDDEKNNKSVSQLIVVCVGLFSRQMGQENSPSASNKPETTVERPKEIAEFIVDISSDFRYWIQVTTTLARHINHCLDSLFQEYKDIKVLAIDLLEVLIENLEYGTSLFYGNL